MVLCISSFPWFYVKNKATTMAILCCRWSLFLTSLFWFANLITTKGSHLLTIPTMFDNFRYRCLEEKCLSYSQVSLWWRSSKNEYENVLAIQRQLEPSLTMAGTTSERGSHRVYEYHVWSHLVLHIRKNMKLYYAIKSMTPNQNFNLLLGAIFPKFLWLYLGIFIRKVTLHFHWELSSGVRDTVCTKTIPHPM